MSKGIVWVRLDAEIEKLVKELAQSKGISVSEHVRQLILRDLDERSFFTTKLKNKTNRGFQSEDVQNMR